MNNKSGISVKIAASHCNTWVKKKKKSKDFKLNKINHTHIHTYLTKLACFKDIFTGKTKYDKKMIYKLMLDLENDARQKYLLNLMIIFQILQTTDGTEQLASAHFVMFSLVVMLAYKWGKE